MINKFHNAWGVLAAIWLTIAPSHAHTTHTFRQQAVPLHGKTVTAGTSERGKLLESLHRAQR